MEAVPINDIVIGARYRQDLGDLTDLMVSIDKIGLLQPVGITHTYGLVFGARRLEACKRLGWLKIPVRVLSDREDAAAMLEAERDENTCRLDMKPTELVALADMLTALEQPKAKARQQEHGGTAPGRSTWVQKNTSESGRTRDKVAKALGVNSSQLGRARHVVRAAADETLPEEVRQVAVTELQRMDDTGNIGGAYVRVRAAEVGRGSDGKSSPPYLVPAEVPADARPFKSRAAVAERREKIRELAAQGYRREQIASIVGVSVNSVWQTARDAGIIIPTVPAAKRPDQRRIVVETVRELEGLIFGLRFLDPDFAADPADANEWALSLRRVRTEISRLITTVEGWK